MHKNCNYYVYNEPLLNQDKFKIKITEKYSLFILADGYGANNSEKFVESLIKKIVDNADNYIQQVQQNIQQGFLDWIEESKNQIKEVVIKNNLLSAKTTLAITLITANQAFIFYCGDTKIFIIKNKSLISTKTHRYKNSLSKFIKFNRQIDGNAENFKISKKHLVVLCTDGLWEKVSEEDLLALYKSNDHEEYITNKLKGTPLNDDRTAIVIKII